MSVTRKQIDAFKAAVEELAFLGTIPEYSDDKEEMAAITQARARIKRNYTRSHNALLRAAGIQEK